MVTAAAAPSPLLAIASAVAQAHWRRRPQNKSRAASPCLRQPACNGARAEQPLWWCRGLLSAQFSPAAAAAPSPLLATAVAVAQAHWRRRPQKKSRAASPCLLQPACNGTRAEQPSFPRLAQWPMAVRLRYPSHAATSSWFMSLPSARTESMNLRYTPSRARSPPSCTSHEL